MTLIRSNLRASNQFSDFSLSILARGLIEGGWGLGRDLY